MFKGKLWKERERKEMHGEREREWQWAQRKRQRGKVSRRACHKPQTKDLAKGDHGVGLAMSRGELWAKSQCMWIEMKLGIVFEQGTVFLIVRVMCNFDECFVCNFFYLWMFCIWFYFLVCLIITTSDIWIRCVSTVIMKWQSGTWSLQRRRDQDKR